MYKFQRIATMFAAVALGAASMTACTPTYHVRTSPPVYYRQRPVFIQPTPTVIVRPAPIVLRSRPGYIGTVDSRDGKLNRSDRINRNAPTYYDYAGRNRVNVNVPYRDSYTGAPYTMRERHKVHVDTFGREYIRANGTGNREYLRSNGTVNTGRHHRHY